MYSFDLDTRVMTSLKVTGNVPDPRSAHSAVLYKNCMYIYGGWVCILW